MPKIPRGVLSSDQIGRVYHTEVLTSGGVRTVVCLPTFYIMFDGEKKGKGADD